MEGEEDEEEGDDWEYEEVEEEPEVPRREVLQNLLFPLFFVFVCPKTLFRDSLAQSQLITIEVEASKRRVGSGEKQCLLTLIKQTTGRC